MWCVVRDICDKNEAQHGCGLKNSKRGFVLFEFGDVPERFSDASERTPSVETVCQNTPCHVL